MNELFTEFATYAFLGAWVGFMVGFLVAHFLTFDPLDVEDEILSATDPRHHHEGDAIRATHRDALACRAVGRVQIDRCPTETDIEEPSKCFHASPSWGLVPTGNASG